MTTTVNPASAPAYQGAPAIGAAIVGALTAAALDIRAMAGVGVMVAALGREARRPRWLRPWRHVSSAGGEWSAYPGR